MQCNKHDAKIYKEIKCVKSVKLFSNGIKQPKFTPIEHDFLFKAVNKYIIIKNKILTLAKNVR